MEAILVSQSAVLFCLHMVVAYRLFIYAIMLGTFYMPLCNSVSHIAFRLRVGVPTEICWRYSLEYFFRTLGKSNDVCPDRESEKIPNIPKLQKAQAGASFRQKRYELPSFLKVKILH